VVFGASAALEPETTPKTIANDAAPAANATAPTRRRFAPIDCFPNLDMLLLLS
jgi:hypothetical protein